LKARNLTFKKSLKLLSLSDRKSLLQQLYAKAEYGFSSKNAVLYHDTSQ